MSELSKKHCVPCAEGTAPLKGKAATELLEETGGGWRVVDDHHLTKTFRFDDFMGALAFVNGVGRLAEEEGHHPDIHLSWGVVRVDAWTHKIKGLSENDFILAAKIDKL